MEFRIADHNDVEALKALDAASTKADGFGPILNDRMLDHYLGCAGLIVAEGDGQLAGYVLTNLVDWMHGAGPLVWVEHIGVHPGYRRRGVGLELLRFVQRHYKGRAECLHASIHPLNTVSLRLFDKLGAESGERVLVFKGLD